MMGIQNHIGRAAGTAGGVLRQQRVILPKLRHAAAVKGQRQPLPLQLRHEPLVIGAGKSDLQGGHDVGRLVGP